MNLSHLSNAELAETLRRLAEQSKVDAANVERLESAVESLHVHRIELEMQNRALRETQEKLEQAVSRYTDLYDHLPLGYLTMTTVGRITTANPAAAGLLNVPREQLIGSHFRKFLDAYDAGRFAAHLEGCATSPAKAVIELTLRRPDGATRAVQLTSRQAPPGTGEGIQIHVAVTDVSALKQTQRALEAANREQEVFNHSLSHDLRAPLVTITNYARLVLSEHGEQLDEEGRLMVQRIEVSAGRLERILHNVLEFNLLSREELTLHGVQVEDVARHVLSEVRAEIEAANAQVTIDTPLPRVIASRTTLTQVFLHLLRNAMMYAKPGEPPRVHFSAEIIGKLALLKIADEGIGIDPKHHERIFSLFERLHGYSRYPGSGLGLAIVRRAMERMGGRIWVESELGKGSCFHLELPAG